MTQKSLFAPIAARFGFVFIDQYSVLHDGQRPYPGAIEALATLKAREARVVILSNSGRSAAYNARRLADLGIAEDLYDHFVTSGDVAKRALQDGKIGFTVGRGARCMTVSGSSSHDLVDTLGLVSTDDGDAAELLIISGSASLSVRVGRDCVFRGEPASGGMEKAALSARPPKQQVLGVDREDAGWSVSVNCRGPAACPVCGAQSRSRHSFYLRSLQDLPAQGTPVMMRARLTRWRCQNDYCERRIFAERLPELAAPYARRTARMAGIVRLFGHSAGGRASERLMARLGMPVGHTTILRSVKKSARTHGGLASVRVAGIDDWAWKKGMNYGTVIVDLEQRQVVGLLADRSAVSTAEWLKGHPEIEISTQQSEYSNPRGNCGRMARPSGALARSSPRLPANRLRPPR